ncbi:MAG: sulfite exporter TauE/SafE family protein [Bdellovibrionales bacterium]|nr:sulfite exporter TauE/SafE family protein [Bdellovibrionales bacterium]
MSDLFNNFQNFFPWVSFVAGLGGSLHCVGMCGGLVTASCEKNSDVIRYQLGRLGGYLALGIAGGFIGSLIKFETKSPLLTVIPGLIIGLSFFYWGIQNWRGKKAEIQLPRFMGKFYSFLWKKLVFKNMNFSKALFTGMISIFLPCGLLYGIVLSTLALAHPIMALFSMFFFWLGTLPSMILAPSLFQKLLAPIKNKIPKTYAISLIAIGLLTVSFRVIKFQELNRIAPETKVVHEMKCH